MRIHHIITLFKQLQRRLIVPDPHVQPSQLKTHIIAPLAMRDMIPNQPQIHPHISPIPRGTRLRQQPIPVLPEHIGVAAAQPQQVEDGLRGERGFRGERSDQVKVRRRREIAQGNLRPAQRAPQRRFPHSERHDPRLPLTPRLRFYPKPLVQPTHPRETPHPARQLRQEREIHRQPGKARHRNRRIRG